VTLGCHGRTLAITLVAFTNDKKVLRDVQINIPGEEEIILQCSVDDFDYTIDRYAEELKNKDKNIFFKGKLLGLLDSECGKNETTIENLITHVTRNRKAICMIKEPGHFRVLQSTPDSI
jgi:hypothetical protein